MRRSPFAVKTREFFVLSCSLDAGATEISITVKHGGIGMVQIQDNGCGIKVPTLTVASGWAGTDKLFSGFSAELAVNRDTQFKENTSISHQNINITDKTAGLRQDKSFHSFVVLQSSPWFAVGSPGFAVGSRRQKDVRSAPNSPVLM